MAHRVQRHLDKDGYTGSVCTFVELNYHCEKAAKQIFETKIQGRSLGLEHAFAGQFLYPAEDSQGYRHYCFVRKLAVKKLDKNILLHLNAYSCWIQVVLSVNRSAFLRITNWFFSNHSHVKCALVMMSDWEL